MKLEGRNPGGSIKDRVALSLVEQAEADGILCRGSPARSSSSRPRKHRGGAGPRLQIRGYHLKVVLPDSVSIERRQLLEIFGAEIIDSPGEQGSNGAVRWPAGRPRTTPSGHILYQYGNQANPAAHYRRPAPRSWPTAPRSPTSWSGSGRRGRSSGSGGT